MAPLVGGGAILQGLLCLKGQLRDSPGRCRFRKGTGIATFVPSQPQ